MMSANQSSQTQDEKYSIRGVASISNYLTRRTVATAAQFFMPYLQPNMRLLDCGCGPGTISVGLAQAIAPGQLVGIDIDDHHLTWAEQHAAELAVTNVRFEAANVYQLPFADASFDAVFSHALLEHLERPMEALAEMHRVLKPQGIIGIRIPEDDGYITWPQPPVFQEWREFVPKVHASHGGSAFRGKQLRTLLHKANFINTRMSASYENISTPEEIYAWTEAMASAGEDPIFIERADQRGLIDRETLASYVTAIRAWAQHPDAFAANAWCEIVGWRR